MRCLAIWDAHLDERTAPLSHPTLGWDQLDLEKEK